MDGSAPSATYTPGQPSVTATATDAGTPSISTGWTVPTEAASQSSTSALAVSASTGPGGEVTASGWKA
ncbi:hypothetical protein [Pimelobacter simplex]|uniref:hypothetical protein n=1 Tax=Nocardioides simplex TaxID=2045 RepID=UPI003AAB5D7F